MPEEIANGVFLIDTLAAGVQGLVACYLVKGEKCALVDAGYPTSADPILAELKAIDPSASHVDYLIPTHVHLDHAGAVGHLARIMPNARILVSRHGAKHLADPTKFTQTAARFFGDEAMSLFGEPVPAPADRIEGVSDSYSLDLGAGKRIKIFWTPGHAWHHVSVLLEGERILFTGDAVGVRYAGYDDPIPATPPPGFDPDQYLKTIAGFIEMNPKELLLPHFGVVQKNVRGFLESNRITIERWLSQAHEVVKSGESLERLFDLFLTDIMNRTGKSRDMIPEHVLWSIMFTAKGCYGYAQSASNNQDQRNRV